MSILQNQHRELNSASRFKNFLDNADFKSISQFFRMDAEISDLAEKDLPDPWNEVMRYQKMFRIQPTLILYRKILSYHWLFKDNEASVVFKQILLNSLHINQFIDLTDILLYFIRYNNPFSVFIFNMYCFYKIEFNSFDNLRDVLLSVPVPIVVNKNYYVFYYFRGIILFLNEEFSEGFRSLKVASKSKKLRKYFFPDYFLSSLLAIGNNNEMEKEDFRCFRNIQLIVREGLFNRIFNVIPTNTVLCVKILKFLPYVCLRNLLKKFVKNSKIYLDNVFRCLDFPKEEVLNHIVNCMEKGLVRGYLNIESEIIVLSKVNPFPVLLDNS